MANLQNWQDLYTELAKILTEKVNNLQWVDLWHNQVNFLADEHPFPVPAAFISFRMLSPEDMGDSCVQHIKDTVPECREKKNHH